MSRLADRIRELGLDAVDEALSKELQWRLWSDYPIIAIDNVAHYYFEVAGKHPSEWGPWDFPNVAPPFTSAFFEFPWRLAWSPANARGPQPCHVGLWMSALEIRDGIWPGGRQAILDDAPPDARWHVSQVSVVQYHEHRPPVGGVVLGYYVNDHGEFLQRGTDIVFRAKSVQPRHAALSVDERRDIAEVLMRAVHYPAMLAVSFMHCKNVGQPLVEPPPKLSRAHERRHGQPLVKYYTLQIDPMREVLKREGGSEQHGLKKALHICRGHFATYREERPLFGRVAGTVWRPMHTRGQAKDRLVIKDYAVHPAS